MCLTLLRSCVRHFFVFTCLTLLSSCVRHFFIFMCLTLLRSGVRHFVIFMCLTFVIFMCLMLFAFDCLTLLLLDVMSKMNMLLPLSVICRALSYLIRNVLYETPKKCRPWYFQLHTLFSITCNHGYQLYSICKLSLIFS